jgi:hypothetical protein
MEAAVISMLLIPRQRWAALMEIFSRKLGNVMTMLKNLYRSIVNLVFLELQI